MPAGRLFSSVMARRGAEAACSRGASYDGRCVEKVGISVSQPAGFCHYHVVDLRYHFDDSRIYTDTGRDRRFEGRCRESASIVFVDAMLQPALYSDALMPAETRTLLRGIRRKACRKTITDAPPAPNIS